MSDRSPSPGRASVSCRIRVEGGRVLELFGEHVLGWIRPAFTLAPPGTPHAKPELWLGRPDRGGPGVVTVPLRWSPGQGPSTFVRCCGRLTVDASGPSTTLQLEGAVVGGEDGANEALLGAVLRLVARALEEAYREP